MATTAMNTHRFGKVVLAPEIEGIGDVDEVPIPDDVGAELESAIRDGDAQKLENLLAKIPHGARVSKAPTRKGESLLHLAAEFGYTKCAKVLVEKGKIPVDIALRDKTQPIHYAALGAHEACIAYLLEAGADREAKNVHGETPLHILAKAPQSNRAEHYLSCITRLVNAGANINSRDNSEMTPLHKAAVHGQLEVAKALLKLNAYLFFLYVFSSKKMSNLI